MAIFARFAYAGGADVAGILLARFTIAGALLAALMVATGRPWPRGRALGVAIAMGGVGYVGQAASFFSALEHASAGLVALIFYSYPTLVTLLSATFLGERLTAARLAWLAVSFAGLALTLGAGGGGELGIVLALSAAAFYSVYIVVGARELGRVDALAATTVVCLSAAASLVLASAVRAPQLPVLPSGWLAAVAIAVVSTVVAILAFFAGLKRVGPARAAVASTLEPIVTVVLAWIVFGEALSAMQLLGGALVLGAAARLARA